MTPETLAKAVTLPVIPKGDGTYNVVGEHGTYSIYYLGEGLRCSCPQGRSGACAHRLAVEFYEKCDTTPRQLDVTTISERIGEMDGYQLGVAMNAITVMGWVLSEERQRQNTRLADLRVQAGRFRMLGDEESFATVNDEVIIQRSVVDNLQIRASALRDVKIALHAIFNKDYGKYK